VQEVPALVRYLLMRFGYQQPGIGPVFRSGLLAGEGPLSLAKKFLGLTEEFRVMVTEMRSGPA